MISLHCIVLVAILFPGHPYIESADNTLLSCSIMLLFMKMETIYACSNMKYIIVMEPHSDLWLYISEPDKPPPTQLQTLLV